MYSGGSVNSVRPHALRRIIYDILKKYVAPKWGLHDFFFKISKYNLPGGYKLHKSLFLKALEYCTYKNNFFYDLRTKGTRYEILKKMFFSKFDEIWVIFVIFF